MQLNKSKKYTIGILPRAFIQSYDYHNMDSLITWKGQTLVTYFISLIMENQMHFFFTYKKDWSPSSRTTTPPPAPPPSLLFPTPRLLFGMISLSLLIVLLERQSNSNKLSCMLLIIIQGLSTWTLLWSKSLFSLLALKSQVEIPQISLWNVMAKI